MKLTKITKTTTINRIVDEIPDAPRLLMEKYGLFCVGCPMAQAETIGQGAESHGLSEKKTKNLLKELNTKLVKKTQK
jgi:hybrid cluster-associated redox disulfide protein